MRLAAAVGVIGVSFGAISVAEGLPGWAPVLMSLLVGAILAGRKAPFVVVVVAAAGTAALLRLAGLP